ncbi:hypothetical protein MOQ_006095 [Trypanosoma cruzi marinkellei]|uniref:BAR domain-containing protein n=1 Tax=Trypanosoma cruzi marinkellei TaxID=85056 RepID=K2MSU8_TRYCR|nr:hypothetical protein MOQ_006095 [Trypanosoma cruzi marinkellei]
MSCCSKIPETADKELDENGAYLTNITKTFKFFEKSIAETLNTYQVLMNSFEKVAQCFAEIAGGSSKNMVELADGFKDGMRKLRDGPTLSGLQMNMTRYVKEGLPPLMAERKKVYKLYKRAKKLKKAEDTCRQKIGEMEREFAKKNRPLTESKSYAKLGKDRERATIKYQGKKQEFVTAMEMFKDLIERFLGTSLPGYAACTSSFSRHLGQVMETYISGEHMISSTNGGSQLTNSRPRMSQRISDGNGDQLVNGNQGKNPLSLEEQYYQGE